MLQRFTHHIIVLLRQHTNTGTPLQGVSKLVLNSGMKIATDASLLKTIQNNDGLFAAMSQLAWERDINLTGHGHGGRVQVNSAASSRRKSSSRNASVAVAAVENDAIPEIELATVGEAKTSCDNLPRISHNVFMRTNRIEPLNLRTGQLTTPTDDHHINEWNSVTRRRESSANHATVALTTSTDSLINSTSHEQK